MIIDNPYLQCSRLLLELETGGNVRLEEGKPGHIWYNSCVELVKSRFFREDFERLGISSIKIQRVTRIHNRFLKTRFEVIFCNKILNDLGIS